jgi:radical SAM superfamily enzyme YgiQ (UPF0313 family)
VLSSALKKRGFEVSQRNLEIDIVASKIRKQSDVALSWLTEHIKIKEYINDNKVSEGIASFLKYLEKYDRWGDYDIVCLSVIGEIQIGSSAVIATYLKQNYPELKIVMGGQFIVSQPWRGKSLLQQIGCSSIDLIYEHDDGGKSFSQWLIEIYNFGEIQQDSFSGIVRTNKSQIDQYEIPDFEINLSVQKELSKNIYGIDLNWPMLQYLISNGCVSNCSFCTRKQKTFSYKLPSLIANELSLLSTKFSTPFIKFECDLINPSFDWVNSLAQNIINKRIDIVWNAYAKISPMDPSTTILLRRAGCIFLRFGVETGSDRVLKILQKKHTISDAEETLRLTKEQGIWNGLLFMVGVPGETEDDIEKTVTFIRKNRNNIDSAIVNVFDLLRGTSMFLNPNKYGIQVLHDQRSGAICFNDLGANRCWEKQEEYAIWAHNRVSQALLDEGIGLSGTSVDLIHLALMKYQDHSSTHAWLLRQHPQFMELLPHHAQRWKLYHPTEDYPFANYESPVFSSRLGYSGIEVTGNKYSMVNSEENAISSN